MKLTFYRLLISILILLSFNINSEVLEEVIVLEKKTTTLNGWSQNLSISSLNSDELVKMSMKF